MKPTPASCFAFSLLLVCIGATISCKQVQRAEAPPPTLENELRSIPDQGTATFRCNPNDQPAYEVPWTGDHDDLAIQLITAMTDCHMAKASTAGNEPHHAQVVGAGMATVGKGE